MAPADRTRSTAVRRRTVIGAVGTVLTGSAIASGRTAEQGESIVLEQGNQCIPVTPLTGSDEVATFYDYRIPERFASRENGGSDPGTGPYYSSVGTEALQRANASVLFLYDGPDGRSLVIVHGSVGSGGDGGAASFQLGGLPDAGEWVVKDDLYRDPRTGEFAETNYDRWDVDGSTHTIHWTWSATGTDGGAFRGLDGDFQVEITPSFNQQSPLYGRHYAGDVGEWQLLTGDRSDPDRHSLRLDQPIVIRTGSCGEQVLASASDGTATATVRSTGEVQVRQPREGTSQPSQPSNDGTAGQPDEQSGDGGGSNGAGESDGDGGDSGGDGESDADGDDGVRAAAGDAEAEVADGTARVKAGNLEIEVGTGDEDDEDDDE